MTDIKIILIALCLAKSARMMVRILDAEIAAGRGKGEVANTIREAMPGMNYVCKCIADLIPKPVTEAPDHEKR
jgi:hypothetical protein